MRNELPLNRDPKASRERTAFFPIILHGSSLPVRRPSGNLGIWRPHGCDLMNYPLWCVLPNDRAVYVDEYEQVRALQSCGSEHSDLSSFLVHQPCAAALRIPFFGKDCDEAVSLTVEEMEKMFRFVYTPFLVFMHEKLLREVLRTKCSLDQSELRDAIFQMDFDSLKQQVYSGYVHPGLVIRHIGEVDGVDVGHGLFAAERIPSGTFLGEYVGIVVQSASRSAGVYCCQYASCEGDQHVDAAEYGNLIRFINHSSDCPNAQLRVVQIDGLPHILCFTTQAVGGGAQVLISYGAAYWQQRRHTEDTEGGIGTIGEQIGLR